MHTAPATTLPAVQSEVTPDRKVADADTDRWLAAAAAKAAACRGQQHNGTAQRTSLKTLLGTENPEKLYHPSTVLSSKAAVSGRFRRAQPHNRPWTLGRQPLGMIPCHFGGCRVTGTCDQSGIPQGCKRFCRVFSELPSEAHTRTSLQSACGARAAADQAWDQGATEKQRIQARHDAAMAARDRDGVTTF